MLLNEKAGEEAMGCTSMTQKPGGIRIRALLARLALPTLMLSGLLFIQCGRRPGEVRISIVLGPDYILGAELAAEEINGQGGIRGKRLVLDIDRSLASNDATLAIRSATRIAQSAETVAVVGHGTSSASLSAAQVYNEAGIVQLVPMATSPLLAYAGSWTFRICINDTQQGRLLADYVFDSLHKRKVFIFQVNDDYGKGLHYYFKKRFIERGGDVCYQAVYSQEATNFAPYMALISRLGPELIFFAGRIDELIKLRRDLQWSGLEALIIGGDALYVSSQIKKEKTYSEGLMLTLFFHPAFERAAAKAFVANFRTRFGVTPDPRGALTYDAMYLLKTAMEKGGTSREGIRQYLSLVGSSQPAFEGVTGGISFRENGNAAESLQVGVVRQGEVLVARGMRPPGSSRE